MLTEGEFVTQEHETTGVARLVELPDGTRLVRLEGFATSDGPDLHVWLTDQSAGGAWSKYDAGAFRPWASSRPPRATRTTRYPPAPTRPGSPAW